MSNKEVKDFTRICLNELIARYGTTAALLLET